MRIDTAGVLHVHIAPSDRESAWWAQRLGAKLPAQAIASYNVPKSISVRVHSTPLTCERWDNVTAFFIKPYHLNNLAHLYNENILPLIDTMHDARGERRLFA